MNNLHQNFFLFHGTFVKVIRIDEVQTNILNPKDYD